MSNLANYEVSEKQAEYIRNSTHRWNGKVRLLERLNVEKHILIHYL